MSSDECNNCPLHGFPCLNCADYELKGKMGPGYLDKQRVLLLDTCQEVRDKMIKVAKNMKLDYVVESKVVEENNIDNHQG